MISNTFWAIASVTLNSKRKFLTLQEANEVLASNICFKGWAVKATEMRRVLGVAGLRGVPGATSLMRVVGLQH